MRFFAILFTCTYKYNSANVKNLVNHNNKKTFKFIIKTLEDLNYKVFYKVINSCDFGLAQSRNRVYIIALHKEKLKNCEFIFPTGFNSKIVVKDILENHNINKYIIDSKEFTIDINKVNKNMIHKTSFRVGAFKKGGQGEQIYSIYGKAIPLLAEGGGIAAKTGAYYVNGNIRKLSPIECARLQGFPTTFKIIHSDKSLKTIW
ncbi:DNA (cytosine-5-)-methyltransferase [Spiroplasma endosymbiont of Asaphidion curtum]|uniref:DNA (cytosine-5-)-methyltransferase n=1 Tax=Spiroplasma endosymbiont of Asaphidion curtum TaxID=3066281 RepID=UPI00313B8362